jgi:type I restriction enzyme M protein
MNGAKAQKAVQILWNASKSLQGGGVSYFEYMTELTYLLFIKMLSEVERDGSLLETRIPEQWRWSRLTKLENEELLSHYRDLLRELGSEAINELPLVQEVFADAHTSITVPSALETLVETIDKIAWHDYRDDGLGDVYEGLLEKTSSERKSKAGQYFTPRALIETIVKLVNPQAGEIIQDPAAGTAGFLIAAHNLISNHTDNFTKLSDKKRVRQRTMVYQGAELITGTHRLSTMNLVLHGIDSPLQCADALGPKFKFDPADVILSNPPFNKFPDTTDRSDLEITANTPKGPLPFVEHIVRSLKVGGRAAVVLPDNFLFEENLTRRLRSWMMDCCDLHTILRLPTGIFYAQGVKTNVLFFTKKSEKAVGATKAVWVYDMRTQMPNFGKTRTLTTHDFEPLVKAYGQDPFDGENRKDEGPAGRFRRFSRQDVADRNDNLDISWLPTDPGALEDELTNLDDIAIAIKNHLQSALAEIEAVVDELAENGATEA